MALPSSDPDDSFPLPTSDSDAVTQIRLTVTVATAQRRPRVARRRQRGIRGARGLPDRSRSRSKSPSPRSPRRILELFSGTGSVGKTFKAHGWEVVSLDITDQGGYTPTHMVDILSWDFIEAYPSRYFEVVWASPPCEHYSIARTTALTPRNLPYYDSLVAKSLDIIKHFRPKYYFIETPASGLLRTRSVIKGERWLDVDYCMYGSEYRKRTRIWGVFPSAWTPADCWSCVASGSRKHKSTAQRGSGWSLNQLHHIPQALVEELASSIK